MKQGVFIMGFVKKVVGGLLGSAPKVKAPKPVAAAPVQDITGEKKSAKTARANLYATEGGVTGQELTPDQVGKRPTLLGN